MRGRAKRMMMPRCAAWSSAPKLVDGSRGAALITAGDAIAAGPVAVALPMPPVPPVTGMYLPAIEGASVMACSCPAAVGQRDHRSLVPGRQPGCAVAGEECQDFADRC